MYPTQSRRVLWKAAVSGDATRVPAAEKPSCANSPMARCLKRAQRPQPLTQTNISKIQHPTMAPAPMEPLVASSPLLLLISVTT